MKFTLTGGLLIVGLLLMSCGKKDSANGSSSGNNGVMFAEFDTLNSIDANRVSSGSTRVKGNVRIEKVNDKTAKVTFTGEGNSQQSVSEFSMDGIPPREEMKKLLSDNCAHMGGKPENVNTSAGNIPTCRVEQEGDTTWYGEVPFMVVKQVNSQTVEGQKQTFEMTIRSFGWQSRVVIEVFERQSSQKGPLLLVLGSIHGNEKCGTHALRRFLKELDEGKWKLLKGTLKAVPVCNPEAFKQNKRFVEENLNRVIFPSENPQVYERKLANEIAPLIEKADYLLDLHSMQAKGKAFSMLNAPSEKSLEFCKCLGAEAVVTGWPEVFAAHPEVLSCCTQTYADKFNIPNALIECGSHEDPEAIDVAYRAILGALKFLGLLDAAQISKNGLSVSDTKTRTIALEEVIFRENLEDKFVKEWKSFEKFQKGETIALRKNGNEVKAPFDGLIVFPNPLSPVGVEWFFFAQEKQLYS